MDNRAKFKEIMRLKREARKRGISGGQGGLIPKATSAEQSRSKAEEMLLSLAGDDAGALGTILPVLSGARVQCIVPTTTTTTHQPARMDEVFGEADEEEDVPPLFILDPHRSSEACLPLSTPR